MASDSHDSHRKHSRSSSNDDSPEKSKRHKHRHHRHHRRHRHHHRHSSSKHGDAKKDEIEVVNREEVVEESVDTDLENPESNHNVTRNDKSGKSKKYLKSPRSDRSGSEGKEDGSHSHHDEFPVSDRVANGDLTRRSRKGESRSHTGHESPLKERSKEKDHVRTKSKHALELMEVDEDDLRGRRDSYSLKVRDDRHEARYRSPSHGRYHLETSDRSRSKSPDRKKERERSQSIAHERYSKTRHHNERDEKLYDNGKVGYEMDGEKDSRAGKDYRSNGGEKVKDKGGERSSSYHRSSLHEGKHEDGDSKDNETEEKMYRDKKRVEPEPIKERSERDRDRIRSRDYERERDFVRDREIHREVKNDIDRNRDRDRDAERERDKERDRSRKSEMDRGRDRYSGSDRHRDKARDDEDDRSSRYHKFDDRDDVYSNRDRRRGYDEAEYFKDRKMKHDPYEDKATKDDSLKENEDAMNGDDDDKDTLELKPAEPEEDDIDRIKEESRRRREAILQKYKAKQSQQQQAVPQVSKDEELTKQPSLKLSSASTGQKENNGAKGDANKNSVDDTSLYLGKSAPGNDSAAAERNTVMLGEGSPKSERSNDMFCDDIFGDSPAGVRKMGKGDGLPLERSGLNDNWDDPEGYYSFRFGEVLDSRYEITAAHGKGVFSTVVRAKDLKAGSGDPEEVAIKIIRNNETMLKAGTEELVILKKLVGADPDDRRHCVRYLSNFKYRNHLCIVFESLHMNLREVLKKFGRNIGLKLTAVRTYAKQLFIALKHLRNCGVLHCDIKPDNMLVNESKNVLKLCDFGNAMFAGKNEITPYLVSRFYRAPEIILGLTYDHPMDIWSVGCCLYELYTGKVLFPGPSNNDMLRLHMELKGPFPKKMLRKGAFIEQHFDQDLNFLALEEDPVTKKTLRKVIVNIKPKDVGNIIRGFSGEDPKMLANFKDLLEKIFVLDPDKRLTVSQALNHPFITASEFRC
uniref:Serine/threonine-protein kinase PRP4 homolog n=1 Tax=Chenopodium quinoa TaxID=63459 RepID=A0A803KV34_CHEQI